MIKYRVYEYHLVRIVDSLDRIPQTYDDAFKLTQRFYDDIGYMDGIEFFDSHQWNWSSSNGIKEFDTREEAESYYMTAGESFIKKQGIKDTVYFVSLCLVHICEVETNPLDDYDLGIETPLANRVGGFDGYMSQLRIY